MGFGNLCTPARLYFVISMIAMVVIGYQNIGNYDIYCIGSYSCDVSNTGLIFLIKFMYILFWTWILNMLCNRGSPLLAWFLILIPFLLLFVILSFLFLNPITLYAASRIVY